jgi:hypothetical protein
MELRVNVDYNQILDLIQQLPVQDIERLTTTLQTGLTQKKEIEKSKLVDLILSSPTWTDHEYHDYLKAREQINKTKHAK